MRIITGFDGRQAQVVFDAADHGLPSSIASTVTVKSSVMFAQGMKSISIGVSNTQAGTVSIQRYADSQGQSPVGAAIQGTLVAAVPLAIGTNDLTPFGSFQISVLNSGLVSSTLSGISIVGAL